MTTTDTIARRVANVLADLTDMDQHPDPHTTLDDFGLDSLDHVELSMAIEEEFDIEVDTDVIHDGSTITSIAKMVEATQ